MNQQDTFTSPIWVNYLGRQVAEPREHISVTIYQSPHSDEGIWFWRVMIDGRQIVASGISRSLNGARRAGLKLADDATFINDWLLPLTIEQR